MPSSIGEVRVPALAAGKFNDEQMITCPWMSLGESERISLPSATWPSHSSPWLPALRKTFGPLPFLTEAMGIGSQP